MRNDNPLHGSAYLLRRNLILKEGLIAAPAAVCTDTLRQALSVSLIFCCITAITVLAGTLIPRRVPFAFRILSYSVIAALVYIPTVQAADYLLGSSPSAMYYLPLLSGGLLLTSQHDRLFFADRLTTLLGRLVGMLLGVSAVLLGMGIVRELLGMGTLLGTKLLLVSPLPIMQKPAFGLLLLACLCIAAQTIAQREEAASDDDCH